MRSFRVTLQFHTYLCELSHRTGVNELMAHDNGGERERAKAAHQGTDSGTNSPTGFFFFLVLGRLKTRGHSRLIGLTSRSDLHLDHASVVL